jgi:hypothetical protein
MIVGDGAYVSELHAAFILKVHEKEVVYTSETSSMLPTTTWCKNSRTELTSTALYNDRKFHISRQSNTVGVRLQACDVLKMPSIQLTHICCNHPVIYCLIKLCNEAVSTADIIYLRIGVQGNCEMWIRGVREVVVFSYLKVLSAGFCGVIEVNHDKCKANPGPRSEPDTFGK